MAIGVQEAAGRMTRPTDRMQPGQVPTVVVVTYNSRRHLEEFLVTVRPALDAIGGALVVADNDSTDGSVELVEGQAPWAHVVRCGGNLGYAGALNHAVRTFGVDQPVILLNPDCRPRPDSLRHLLDALARPGVGAVVPRFVETDGTLNHSNRRAPSVLRVLGENVLGHRIASRFASLDETITADSAYARDADVVWATGAAVAMSSECLRQVGPWLSEFFLYCEETDYLLRVADAGLRVRYVAAAEILHHGGESNTSPTLYALLTRNAVELHRLHGGPVRAALVRVILIAGELLRLPLDRARHGAALRALVGSQQAAVRRAGGSPPPTGSGW